MSYGFTRQQAAEYDRWKTTPPDDSDEECPLCGWEIEEEGDGWHCTNDDCKWEVYPDEGPDYDPTEDD